MIVSCTYIRVAALPLAPPINSTSCSHSVALVQVLAPCVPFHLDRCDDMTIIFKLENYGYNVWVYIVQYKAVAEGQKQRAQERD